MTEETSWLDTPVDWDFVGNPITRRQCIKSQCGDLALAYVESAIADVQAKHEEEDQFNFKALIKAADNGIEQLSELLKGIGQALSEPDTVREDFEQWAEDVHDIGGDDFAWEEDRNCYTNYYVHLAWKAYQAGRKF